jgi:hypothetical protein
MSSCRVSVILVRSESKLNFGRQFFEKSSNIKFHQHPSSGSRVFPCGRTDKYDEDTKNELITHSKETYYKITVLVNVYIIIFIITDRELDRLNSADIQIL